MFLSTVPRPSGSVVSVSVVSSIPDEAKLCLRRFSSRTSIEACEKSSQWLWKESFVSTGVRKPGNTCASPTAMI